MSGVFRLDSGGRVDRSVAVQFTVDGVKYEGLRGDTLASALLAHGVIEVGLSSYRQRHRGIFSAGVEEPNALVQLDAPGHEPMLAATTVELYDGLGAEWLSGRGRLIEAPEAARYDKKYAHCDVLVVGAGPAGLAAALTASRSGARVIVVDEQSEPGGTLLFSRDEIDGAPALEWVASVCAELDRAPDVRMLSRSTAFAYHDHNYVLVAERRTDHLGPLAPTGTSRQRLWHVRAKRVVLATGAHERPIVFADNDRPGVMLASAARTYLNRYAVKPGRRAVVFTTNDSAYDTAFELAEAGVEVAAIVDTRHQPPTDLISRAAVAGMKVIAGSAVVGTRGEPRLAGVRVAPLTVDGSIAGPASEIECDLLAVSGGWNPVVHLFSQSRGTLRYDEILAAFVPDRSAQEERTIGAARGEYELGGCLSDGFASGGVRRTPAVNARSFVPSAPMWMVPGESGEPEDWSTHFVDLQRDSTVADIYRSTGAGMRSVEHVKRYTTIGTAHDQGKTSGVNAVAVIATALGGSVGQMGTTTFRAPYTPVSFALLAGRDRGRLHDPVRVTSIHPWHVERGAVFEDVGQWKRPRYYPQGSEDMHAAVLRECRAAREGVAVMDASTLGKIDIQGPDAGEFLNRMYTNAFKKLAVGSCRYGVVCKADGMVFDDGVVMRLAENDFLATTTTGGAAAVLDWFEEWLQTEWPELRAYCTSVTEQWATVAVVGPQSRTVMARLAPDLDVSVAGFPFMTWRDVDLACGIPARVARISFSGELAYEINVPAWYGRTVWEAVMAAGEPEGITPYGTETMHVLRAEKGYPIIGQDTDGTVTPQDLGMEWVVSRQKHFVGKRSHRRSDTARSDRHQFVGLLPVQRDELLPEGAQLIEHPAPSDAGIVPMLGHVTSSYHSAALGGTFALGLLESGRARIGQTVYVPLADRTIAVAVTVTDSVLYDKEGTRRDG